MKFTNTCTKYQNEKHGRHDINQYSPLWTDQYYQTLSTMKRSSKAAISVNTRVAESSECENPVSSCSYFLYTFWSGWKYNYYNVSSLYLRLSKILQVRVAYFFKCFNIQHLCIYSYFWVSNSLLMPSWLYYFSGEASKKSSYGPEVWQLPFSNHILSSVNT